MCASIGLSDSSLGIDLKSLIVIHRTVTIKNSAVTMAGVFINTQIRHQYHAVTKIRTQIIQRNLHDSGWIKCSRANFVFLGWDTKQND